MVGTHFLSNCLCTRGGRRGEGVGGGQNIPPFNYYTSYHECPGEGRSKEFYFIFSVLNKRKKKESSRKTYKVHKKLF